MQIFFYANIFGPGLMEAIKGDNSEENPYPRVIIFDKFRFYLQEYFNLKECELANHWIQK